MLLLNNLLKRAEKTRPILTVLQKHKKKENQLHFPLQSFKCSLKIWTDFGELYEVLLSN